MKRITASGLTIAIGLAAGTAPVAANPPGSSAHAESMPGMTMDARNEAVRSERPLLSFALKNSAELGLSADQEKSLQALIDRFGQEADRGRREIGTVERELALLLKREPIDIPQVGTKARIIERLRADLRLNRIQTIADGRAALTSEQRAKLDQLAARQGRSGRGDGTRGVEEMQRFMNSERMPQAMNAMMAMAERMGGGDTMLGMVRMMEMMSMMGGEGMMQNPPRSQQQSEESK